MKAIWLCLVLGAIGCGGSSQHCESGQTSCGGKCVDTTSTNSDCGMCGHACSAAQVCGNGQCSDNCPANQMNCSGMCVDVLSDPMNCNACGSACATGDVCSFGECQPPCDPSMLMSSITDRWGVQWDGLERAPAALDAAAATCKTFGARLPTATELFRVAANQSGDVGQSFNTNYLWSLAPDSDLNEAVIRLSDGGTASAAAAMPAAYRCVCPVPAPRTFSDNRCNGAPGSACFKYGKYNLDSEDRPALRNSAATWECANDRGHLADAPVLASAIHAGLPGSGAYIRTGDVSYYPNATELKWTTSTSGWEPNGNLSAIDLTTPAPFRCTGADFAATPSTSGGTNAFIAPTSTYVGEMTDRAAAAFADAHDACFMAGGHLPRATELAELIQQGLPGGTGAIQWTSDETGYEPTNGQFLVEILHWSGLDRRFDYGYSDTASWDWKYMAFAYRCIYYPVDPTYVAPTCYAGCFEVDLPGTPAPKLWLDSQDRAAASLGTAFADCASSGGQLASERDLTEAIRGGLPNGLASDPSPWIWTSDFAQGNVTIVRWLNVEKTFADQYSADMTWENPANSHRYRCMWTNEVR